MVLEPQDLKLFFELWLPLADAFMQNVFGKSKK